MEATDVLPPPPSLMPVQVWVYRARPMKVVDGDTVDVHVDMGMHALLAMWLEVRFMGYHDSYELLEWLMQHAEHPLALRDEYGRVTALDVPMVELT